MYIISIDKIDVSASNSAFCFEESLNYENYF